MAAASRACQGEAAERFACAGSRSGAEERSWIWGIEAAIPGGSEPSLAIGDWSVCPDVMPGTPISTSDRTIPSVPTFHDGRLTGIAVADKAAKLHLQTSDRATFELHLIGVEGFRADDFWEGNVIFHLEVVQGRPPTRIDVDARLQCLFPPPLPTVSPEYHAARAGRLADMAGRIARGEAALVSLESSYGCDLVALCSGVRLVAQS